MRLSQPAIKYHFTIFPNLYVYHRYFPIIRNEFKHKIFYLIENEKFRNPYIKACAFSFGGETYMVRARLVISGDVQGVGLRAFIKRIARMYGIRGVVRNLEDGTVEVYCECKDDQTLKKFHEIISSRKRKDEKDIFSPHVENIKIYEESEANYKTGREPKKFGLFDIEYGDYEKESLTRTEIGSLLLVDTRERVMKMHKDMMNSFKTIDEKYAHFSQTLDAFKESLDEMIKYIKKFVDAYTKEK